MADIRDYLKKILSSKYGKDVRQSIRDAIYQCYIDGKAGTIDLIARERIDNLVAHNNDTEGNSELIDIRVGADGKTYETAGKAVREQFTNITDDIESMPDDILNIYTWEKFGTELKLELSEKAEKSIYSWPTGIGAVFSTTINYSESIGRSDGSIVLAEPVKSINYKTNESADSLLILRGKYIMVDKVYWIPEDATFSVKDGTEALSLRKVVCNEAQAVNDVSYDRSLGFVSSKNRKKYPDVGESNGNRYEYRGTIGEALTKIEAMK
ncbi:MAG: hypothetical protein ACI4EO_01685 [Blautia sp.]